MEDQLQDIRAGYAGASPQGVTPGANYAQPAVQVSPASADSVMPTLGQPTAQVPTPAATPAPAPRKPRDLRKTLKITGIILLVLLLLGGLWLAIGNLTAPKTDAPEQDASSRFEATQIPLSDLAGSGGDLSVLGTRSLTVNGAIRANDAFTLSPSKQPSNASRGQIYYDQTSDELAYYNGSEFVTLAGGTTIGGSSGDFIFGGGLTVNNNEISNSGVLSVQGQTGNVTLTSGGGIAIDGTTISNSGVLSLGGATGDIAVGSGLSVSGGTLSNEGVVSLTAGTLNLVITDDGSGNLTISDVGGGSGTVQSPGGTNGRIAKFTGVQTIADSLLSESGTTVTVNGDLAVTGSLTLSTALTVGNGGTGATSLANNGVVIAHGASPLTAATSGTPGECLMSTAGAPAFGTCPAASGVLSLNGLTGNLTLANASGSGTTITINDASTSQKGIAQFNGTNFSAASGVVNTIQDIHVAAAPTFGRLTVTSSQATNPMVLVNNTNAGATGNLLDLQHNSVSRLAVTPAGNMTLTGTINGQTISSAANLTGTLAVAGAGTFSSSVAAAGDVQIGTPGFLGKLTVQGTSSQVGVVIRAVAGQTANLLELRDGSNNVNASFGPGGNQLTLGRIAGSGTVTAGSILFGDGTTSGFGATLNTATFTANRTLTIPDASGTICTTAGNCTGVGGGVTTPGGTTNRLAKFTGSQTIGDSIITDNGSIVSIGGTLAVNTITPTGTFTIGSTGQPLTMQGSTAQITATDGGVTNTLTFATPSGGNKTITLPNASGTVAVSASGVIALDSAGNITCPTCATSGSGVTSLNGLTGALTLANASGSGSTVTIDDASTAQKGISQYNATNFSVAGGVVNTIQNIHSGASPNFTNMTLSGDLAVNGGDVTSTGGLNVNATNALTLQGNASSVFNATNGVNTTTLSFQNPTADVNYRFATTAAGTYDICTTVGNCAGTGGGVTTPGGTTGRIAKFTGSQTIGDSLLSEAGSTVTVSGNLNITTGSQFQVNGMQISSANLSNDANLAKLNASQTFTGNTLAFRNGSNSPTAFSIQNAAAGRILTADTTNGEIELGEGSSLGGKLVFNNATNNNTITIVSSVASIDRTITLPDDSGTVCLSTGNCAGAGVTLQAAYNNSTSPEITVDATRGALTIRDASSAIGANLLEVQSNDGATTYFAVTSGGTSTTGTSTASGNINTTGGSLQTNSTTRVDNSGNLTNIGNITGTGAVTIASSGAGNDIIINGADQFVIQDAADFQAAATFNTDVDVSLADTENLAISSTVTGTAAVNLVGVVMTNNTTSGAQNLAFLQNAAGSGTTDGMLLLDNADTDTAVANGIQITSAAGGVTTAIDVSDPDIVTALLFGTNDITGTNFSVTGSSGSILSAGNATLQGGVVTVGTGSQAGTLVVHDGSTNTGTIQVAALGQNTVYTLPDPGGASATICLSTGNCSGAAVSLQGAYNNSTSPEIVLDATRGALTLRDNATPISGSLFEVQSNNGATDYFAVNASGASVTGALTVSSNINSSAGNIQTAGTSRIDSSGNLINIGSISLSGAISGGTTYTGSGNINTTGGAIQTNSTTRIDVTGNLTNIGNITGSGAITIASSGAGNDITVDGADQFLVQDAAVFNGTATFNTNTTFTLTGTETVFINSTLTGTQGTPAFEVDLINNSTSGIQEGIYVANTEGSGTTEALVYLTNADANTAVAAAIEVDSAAGGITNAINVSDPEIVTALLFGANDITGTNLSIAGGTGTITSAGNAVLQGGSVTIGTTSQAGTLILNDGSSNTGTLQLAALGQNTIYTLPDPGAGSATICLSTGNCAGAGGGITGSGTTNQLAKFTAAGAIGNSSISDDGTTVATTVDMVIQGGDITVGTTSQLASLLLHDGNGQKTTLQAGNSTGDLTFILPTTAGSANQCLKQSGAGNQLVWDACDGGGGGSSATLQGAYNNGNSITTTDARDIDIVLANTSTDSNFDLIVADGSTGFVSFTRANGSGTADPAQLLLVDNLDTDRAVPIGIKLQAAGGGLTTAIDATDAEIVDAISVGANNIVGTTGNIDFTNFDVAGSTGNVTAGTYNGQTISSAANFTGSLNVTGATTLQSTLAVTGNTTLTGDLALNGGDLTSSGALNITPGGTLTAGSTSQTLTLQGNAGTTLSATDSGSTTALTFQTPTANVNYRFLTTTAGTYDVCTTAGNCSGAGVTLQTAYNGGNTIATTDARNIAFTLANTATDSNFVVTIADDSTGTAHIVRADGAGTNNPAQLLLLENQDTNQAVANGLVIQSAAGGMTDGLDASDAELVNAVNVGDNTIAGGLAVIDFTNFDVAGNGNVTTAGDVTVNGGDITSTANLNITTSNSVITFDSVEDFVFKNSGTADIVVIDGQNGRLDFNLQDPTFGYFRVNDSSGFASLTADETSVKIGYDADNLGHLLLLDQKLNAGDPTGINGGLYYNDDAGKFRCYEDGAWKDCIASGSSVTLQSAYNNSTSPEITLDSTRGALTLRDASSALGANLFEVQSNSGATTYLGVTASGIAVSGAAAVTGNINSSGGVIQTNSTTRVDNSGNLVNIGDITGTGAMTISATGGGSELTLTAPDEVFVTAGGGIFLNAGDSSGIFAQDKITQTSTYGGSTAADLFSSTITNNTTSGTQRGGVFRNAAGSGTTEALLLLDNADTDTAVTTGLQVTAAAGGIATGIDLSDADIVDAVNVGANNIVGTTGNIDLTNFDVTGSSGDVTAGTYNGQTISSAASFTGSLAVAAATTLNGDITLGDAATDLVTFNGTVQGTNALVFEGSSADANETTFAITDPTADRTVTFGNESGTVCLQNSTNCGFALSSGSGNYIQNQFAADQSADFRISGTGRAGTALQAPLLDTASAAALNIGTTNATAINLNKATVVTGGFTQSGGNFSSTSTGSGSLTAGGSLTITAGGGSTWSTSSGNLTIQAAGTNNLTLQTGGAGTVALGDQNATTINIGRGSNIVRTINIGTGGSSQAQTITMGSTGGASATTIQAGTGNITLNSGGTIELQDNTNVTGNLVASGNGTFQGGTATLGTTSQAGSLILHDGSSNTGTLQVASLGQDVTYTLPDPGGASATICLSTGNCAGAGVTLQAAYNNSTNPEIVLDGTRGALTLRDASSAIGANLLEVQSNDGLTTYFGVTASGVSVAGTATATGNINSSGGALQTNGTTRVDNSGNLVNIGSLTLSGAISGGTTYSGSGNINTTGGVLQTNSTTRVDNSGNLLNIGTITASGTLTLGVTGTSTGTIALKGSTAASGTINLVGQANPTGTRTITLPDEDGTVCLRNSANCGFAAGTAGDFIQNQNVSDQTANFRISGVGRAGTALQAPLFDTATAAALAIGTTNATAINLNQNTTIAATKTLTVTSGATSLTGATTGDALTVSNSTSTGNIAVFNDNATAVFTLADGGAATFRNTTNSTSAFRILNADNSATVFNVDTTNQYVGVGTTSPFSTLSINGNFTLQGASGGVIQAYTGSAYKQMTFDALNYALATSGTTRVAIDASGSVGIGTTTPYSRLTVYGAASAGTNRLSIVNSEGGHTIIQAGITSVSNNGIEFITASVDGSSPVTRMVVGATGNVGIGTNSPSAKLHVSRAASEETDGLRLENTQAGGWGTAIRVYGRQNFGANNIVEMGRIQVQGESSWSSAGTTDAFMHFDVVSDGTLTERMRIESTGNVGINNVDPDKALDVIGEAVFGDGFAGGAALGNDKAVQLTSDTDNHQIGYELFSSEESNNRRATFFLDDSAGLYGFDATASSGSPDFVILSNGSEKLRLDSSGDLGIGTTGPSAKLHVTGTGEIVRIEGDLSTDSPKLSFYQDSTERAFLQYQDSGDDFDINTDGGINFLANNALVMRVAPDSSVRIGASDTTASLLVLDTKTSSGDPTGVNGGLYYNSNSNKFRCYENSAWANCVGSSADTLQTAYDAGNTITTSSARDIDFNLADSATDSNFLVDLQCDTSCSTNGRFAVQDDGTDVVTIAPAGGAVTFKNSGNSATAFRVLNASDVSQLTIDTSTSRVHIGATSADSTGALLVLDTKNTAGDPTGVDGAMYYNSNLGDFRCHRGGVWDACSLFAIDRGFMVQDEFLGGNTTGSQIGELGWKSLTYNGGTSVVVFNTGNLQPSADHPGVIRLKPNDSAGAADAVMALALNSNATTEDSIYLAPGNTVRTTAAVGSASSSTQRFRIGLYDQPDISNNPATGVYWEADPSSNANWRYCYVNVTPTCAASGTAIAANTWVRLSIRITALGSGASAATFTINGTSSTVSSVTINGTNPVNNTIACMAHTTTSRDCYVDYFQFSGYSSAAR